MLTALRSDSSVILAWEAERADGPFVCPNCSQIVILKKGIKRIHHFAHTPPIDCDYAHGETQQHLQIKKEIYNALISHPSVINCALERKVGSVRPDISMRINNIPVAIEVQRSNISIETIITRFQQYTTKNIALLWVLCQPKTILKYGGTVTVYRVTEWHKFLNNIYLNRLYFHKFGATVSTVQTQPYRIHVEATDWSDGYSYRSKVFVLPKHVGDLNIADDFTAFSRKRFERFPGGLLWKSR